MQNLINGTRNEATDVFAISKDVRKRVWKRRRCLNRRKSNLTDAVFSGESKDALDLIQGHATDTQTSFLPEGNRHSVVLLNAYHVAIEFAAYVFKVAENEGPLLIESTGDDVFGILQEVKVRVVQDQRGWTDFSGQMPCSIYGLHFFPEVLLVVCQLYDQWYFKSILQPFGKHKGYEMSQMQRLRRRTLCKCNRLLGDQRSGGSYSPSVEVERDALFVAVEDGIQITMRKEDPSPEKRMRRHLSQALHPGCHTLRKTGSIRSVTHYRSIVSGKILAQPN